MDVAVVGLFRSGGRLPYLHDASLPSVHFSIAVQHKLPLINLV